MRLNSFVTHGATGYVDFSKNFLEHARRMAEFTPQGEPLRIHRGVLAKPAHKCDCNGQRDDSPTTNQTYGEPLKISRGVLS